MKNSTVKITNRNSVAELINGDIFYIHYLPDTFSTLKDFKEEHDSYRTLGKGKKLKVLVEMGDLASINQEAREYKEKSRLGAIAEALVLHTLSQRLIFSLYLKSRIETHPIKVFKNKSSALNWLNNV